VKPRDLDPVMVRRLKSDLRYFGETFPERVVEEIRIAGVPIDAAELVLSRKLIEYGEAIRASTASLPPREAGNVRLTFVGLQQRLLSSIAAFAKTLEVHRKGLLRADSVAKEVAAKAFVHGSAETEDEPSDEIAGATLIQEEEDQAAEAAGALAAAFSDLAVVDEMLEIARKNAPRPDERIRRLVAWIRSNMTKDGRWNERRLVLFMEYEDTRRWVEKRLAEALDDLQPDDRIASFTGSMPSDRREELKCRFNSDPEKDPLRILICTDAAREGINLQMRCHDLIHVDLP
jgi:helicase-like protein